MTQLITHMTRVIRVTCSIATLCKYDSYDTDTGTETVILCDYVGYICISYIKLYHIIVVESCYVIVIVVSM